MNSHDGDKCRLQLLRVQPLPSITVIEDCNCFVESEAWPRSVIKSDKIFVDALLRCVGEAFVEVDGLFAVSLPDERGRDCSGDVPLVCIACWTILLHGTEGPGMFLIAMTITARYHLTRP